MQRVLTLYQASIGKKIAMAVSGLMLVGFLVGHMTGNLKIFLGAEEINHYGEWLREMGAPVLPYGVGLWIVRIVLLAAVFVHILSAWQLYRQSRAARQTRYGKQESISFSYASRTMRWGGVIVLLYIVYHLLHLTVGSAHPDFVPGDVYHNLIIGLSNPIVAGFYIIANLALGLHLYHGLWSMTQTLGLNHPRFNPYRRMVAGVVTFVIIGGFLAVPIAVLTGIVQ